MKRSILFLALLLLLCGCEADVPKPEPVAQETLQESHTVQAQEPLEGLWGVSAAVSFYDTMMPQMSLRQSENGPKTLTTDGTYWLEWNRDGQWVRMSAQKETVWSAQPQALFHGGGIGWVVPLPELYPELPEGEYRIGAKVTETESGQTQRFYGTFTLTQEMLENYAPPFAYERLLWELYHAGEGIDLTLLLPGNDRQETMTLTDIACLDGFKAAMSQYSWIYIPEGKSPDVPPGEPGMQMELASLDGTKTMTFQVDVYLGFVTCTDGEAMTQWCAAADWGTPSSTWKIREIYDELAAAPKRVEFFHDGQPEMVAEYFSDAYCQHLKNQAEGSGWKIEDYQVTSWELERVRSDGFALLGHFTADLTPAAGGFQDDGGQTPVSIGRQFVLQRQPDGIWCCVQFGTGGCWLPEETS